MSVGLHEYQATSVPLSVFSPVGLVEDPAVERLDKRPAEIAERLIVLLNEISNQVGNCQSASEFRAFREDAFPSYMHLMSSLASIFSASVPPQDYPSLIEQSYNALEAEFSSEAARSYFGEEAFLEIRFCVSTLKSAARWLPYLMAHKPDESLRSQEMEIAGQYRASATWTHFHLAGLSIALGKLQPVVPDVLQELLDGLRHAVMVYTHVRLALDLRNVLDERYSEELTVPWDEEDQALANAD